MVDSPLYSTRVIDPFLKLIASRYPQVNIPDLLDDAGIMPWEAADTSHWLSQRQINRFVATAVELTGNPDLAREAGQFSASPEVFGTTRTYLLSFLTPQEVFNRIGDVVSRFSRSSAYTSRPLSAHAVEVTVVPHPGMAEEPFQCENRLGMFEALLRGFNYREKTIEHPECLFNGADCCRYVIRWQPTPATYLRRAQQVEILAAPFVVGAVAVGWPHALGTTALTLSAGFLLLNALETRLRLRESEAGALVLGQARDQLAELLDTNYNHSQLTSEIGQVISSQTSIDEVLGAVVKVLQKRLDFDRGVVLLASEDRTRLVYRAGFGHQEREREHLLRAVFRLDNPDSQGVFVRAFHEQTPYLVDDFEEFERRHTTHSILLARALRVKSFVCCPIICDGVSVGVLAVDNLKTSRPLMQSDKSVLMGIAPVIGMSIRNAELLLAKEREFNSTLHVLAASIDARDPLTAGHSEMVTEYSVGICDEMQLGIDFREGLRVAALLHDYGKIGVPDAILKKEGRLTPEEYEVIKTHSAATRDILERINFEGKYADVPLIAGSHHERWDGSGYPQGLKAEEIPLGARIIAVADYFEAITSKRHYREPMPISVALEELTRHSGSYFDPQVVEAFILCYHRSFNGVSDGEIAGDASHIRAKRIPLEAPVLVETHIGALQGRTCDISVNGIYISVPENLGEGLSVKVEILLPGQEQPVVASGRIAWINAGENRVKPHYPAGCGVELTKVHDPGEILLRAFVNQATGLVH